MNFEYLMRKKSLGIERINDYIMWGEELEESNYTQESVGILARNEFVLTQNWVGYSDYQKKVYNDFKQVAKDLGFEIPEIQLDESPEARTVRSVYKKSDDASAWIYSIDIRAQMDISPASDLTSLLDAMALNCGVYPLGDLWKKLPEKTGKQGLKEILSRDLAFRTVLLSDAEAEKSANEFSSHFSGPVQYFSNCTSGLVTDKSGGSNPLQSLYFWDLGIIILDEKNIGMVVTVAVS